MIEARRWQRSFAEGFLIEQVDEFWDDWMRAVDPVLDDDDLVATVYEALGKRRARSRTRGRLGFPAEVVLRMLLLKHIRQWSFAILEREVRTNLLYREFTRVRGGKVPDAKTLGRLALAVGPEVVATLHQRVVAIAQERKVIGGRKARGYDRSGDQHPLSDRQQLVGGRCACPHAADEEGHGHRGDGGGEAAGPQAERELSAD